MEQREGVSFQRHTWWETEGMGKDTKLYGQKEFYTLVVLEWENQMDRGQSDFAETDRTKC